MKSIQFSSIFFQLISVALFKCSEGVVHYPRLNVAARNTGFHRDLEYSLDFAKAIDCDVVIVQTLHQGFYVSNDQLNDLKRLKLIRSYVPSYINVEWPMEKATPFTVYLFSSANSTSRLKLPIHLRYQSPGRKSFKSIPLYEPSLYLSCINDLYPRLSNRTFNLPCSNSNAIHNVYDLPKAESCDWYDVELISNFEGPATISVPVGNQALSIPVSIATLLVAWAAAAYLIFAIFKQKQRISKKVS